MQVITLYHQGWEKISIHRFLRVSRPTIDAWIRRFEAEHFAGLVDKSSAPHAPARMVWPGADGPLVPPASAMGRPNSSWPTAGRPRPGLRQGLSDPVDPVRPGR